MCNFLKKFPGFGGLNVGLAVVLLTTSGVKGGGLLLVVVDDDSWAVGHWKSDFKLSRD